MKRSEMAQLMLDKQRIAKYFLKSAGSYDQHAKIQDVLADNLVTRLELHGPGTYDRVLEVGCCTGLLTRKFVNRFTVGTLFLNDLVAEFESIVLEKLDGDRACRVEPLFGDIECMEIPDGLDLCISSSTVQWLAGPEEFFKRIAANTLEHGCLAISFFINDTLKEMKEITRVGLNYPDPEILRDFLEKNYDILCFETNLQKLYFHNGRDVLHHIKNTGVGGITPFKWTKKSLIDFECQYGERFATEQGYPVTYKSVTIIARKK